MKKLLVTFASLAMLGLTTPLMTADAPTEDVADMLAFMREKEKLAHDVYLLFSEMYAGDEGGARIFARITESERRHTDAVLGLLDAYGLEDPAAGLAAGEFKDAELLALYTMIVDVASAGYTDALGVGVVIEQKDITDIVQVYSNLLAGSEHHLAAFLKVLGTVEPGAASLDTGKH